jgi:hypothetical protein
MQNEGIRARGGPGWAHPSRPPCPDHTHDLTRRLHLPVLGVYPRPIAHREGGSDRFETQKGEGVSGRPPTVLQNHELSGSGLILSVIRVIIWMVEICECPSCEPFAEPVAFSYPSCGKLHSTADTRGSSFWFPDTMDNPARSNNPANDYHRVQSQRRHRSVISANIEVRPAELRNAHRSIIDEIHVRFER